MQALRSCCCQNQTPCSLHPQILLNSDHPVCSMRRYRKKLEIARKRGLAAPPLPDGADAEIIAMYDEVMANLTLK
eukprot:scaffold100489_cov20-Tisochrysis_lutea.AAC.1